MKRRIFKFMSLNLILSITLLSALIVTAVYRRISEQTTLALKTERVTIITENGDVIFDNYANPDDLDNHLNRPEVIDALNKGYGESERYSDTLLEKTYYYAMKLKDGNILRLSVTSASVYAVIYRLIPAFVISALFALFISFTAARAFTNAVVKPINNIDLSKTEIDTYDELAPFVREIMRQKQQIKEQLNALEHRANTVDAITGGMKEGLILTDKDGVILSANTSALNIFNKNGANGTEQTVITGKNIIEICRDVILLQNMKLCLEGSSTQTVFESANRTYNLYLNPVYEDGFVSGTVMLFLDITETFKAEKQRREFSANVSHELKTPLTTVSALTEMLENGMAQSDEDKTEFLKKISFQTKRLISIVDDIIRLSEFDEGNIQKEFSKVDITQLANSAVDSLMSKAAEKNVTVKVRGNSLTINANARMMDELLYNLIDNGIKYNTDGGSVTVDVEESEGYCKITVTDTGIGIPKEHLERVFERFYTADKSRSKKSGGTGLGLSIVKRIVRFHNGNVEIRSVENAGTGVVCLLPVEGQTHR
jgi:two-component system phosphate regulon sensor histidine kinase PhoR